MSSAATKSVYSDEFFARQVDGSAKSASIIVPLVLSFLPVRSVIDVGCGLGTWAVEFSANGVQDVWGVDGEYVDRSRLRIPQDHFQAHNLTEPVRLNRTFDLAVCVEVAEHLPQSRAHGLISDLTALAPCVLFSAAVPGQGGTNHINEQYLPYWTDLFQKHGYEGVDALRSRILGNASVDWWYQQNVVLFAAPGHALLSKGFVKPQTIIHQNLYEHALHPEMGLKAVVSAIPRAFLRSVRYHFGPKT